MVTSLNAQILVSLQRTQFAQVEEHLEEQEKIQEVRYHMVSDCICCLDFCGAPNTTHSRIKFLEHSVPFMMTDFDDISPGFCEDIKIKSNILTARKI